MNVVELDQVVKCFSEPGGKPLRAVDAVSLAVRSGEFFSLLGESGCGKTTVLRLMGGFEQPDGGTIVIAGQPMAGVPPYRRPVNTVFQSYALFPHLNVYQNIAFGLEMERLARAEVRLRVEEMLALVRLEKLAARKPHQLSGGQKQRVALARALAKRPAVLLLDEPLSALDLKLRQQLRLELKALQRQTGITFIFVTHDQEEALSLSDRVGVMRAGRLLQVGTAAEIYERPTSRFVAEFVGETNWLNGTVEAVEAGVVAVLVPGLGQSVRGVAPVRVAPGERVGVAIRPEKLAVRPTQATREPGVNWFAATLGAGRYEGALTWQEAVLASGERFGLRLANRSGQERLPEGTLCALEARFEDTVVLPTVQPGSVR
ncbi:ABC transporter ATP-binding protein [Gloeobacter morelensis]|uniref:ABC transporter ATP-binding protein n=1 Tax=Gloeobacter morelensis MG652769 TaxID=2781736 RepID=A0ABY3PPE6_9CYAN|nr:ABC transporter ATP-binding protein [Gloeobacter morelensis]UFP95570.1 ABC transporter ATP-binding protein [Gloeobacter morelensis MG652769]